jgi:transcriptional regulator with XRE-family HTH domain
MRSTPQNLPGRLRSVRQALRLTLAGLGAELDPPRSRSIVCEWEKGRCEPSLDTVAQLAQVLNVSPCWLAFGVDHAK